MQRKLTICGLEFMRFRDIPFPYLLLSIFLISLILTVTFSPTNQNFIQSQSAYQSESDSSARNTSTVKPELPIEMEAYRDILEASKMGVIQVEAHLKKNTQLWDSKLRGKPYLPKDAEYPKDIEGNPLILLAQINFAEVPELEEYPNEGILQFFISDSGQNHVWGLNLVADEPFDADKYLQSLKEQSYFRVIYYPTVTTDIKNLQTRFPTFPEAVLPVDDEARLTFTKKSEYISIFDYRFERVFEQDAYDFFEQFGEAQSGFQGASQAACSIGYRVGLCLFFSHYGRTRRNQDKSAVSLEKYPDGA